MSEITVAEINKKLASGEFKTRKNEIGKSSVWKHFREIFDTRSCEKQDYVVCEFCKNILKYKSSTGTSRLSRHAKSCAPPTSSQQIETFFHPSVKKITAEQKEKVLLSCVNLCASDMRPFDIVEGEGFIGLAQTLIDLGSALGKVKATDVLPHRTTISNHVRQVAEKCRKNMLPEVNKIFEETGGALTTDMWTESYRQMSYICITCHFISEDFELKSMVLSTIDFPNVPKTGLNVKSEIVTNLNEIGFDTKNLNQKCVFVTDEGSNIISALKCYKRISCVCHVVNTALKHSFNETAKDFPQLKISIEKCKDLVRYLKKSGLVNELEKSVHQEVETRWNTMHTMLTSVISQFSKIKDLLLKKGEIQRLEEINVELLKFLENFLEIFKLASKQLEGDTYPTIHLVILWRHKLKKHCIPTLMDCEITKMMKEKTEEWLEKKMKIEDIHKVAVFLHPKFKSLKLLNESEKKEVHSVVKNMMKETELHLPMSEINASQSNESVVENKLDFFDEWADAKTVPSEKDEVDTYIDLTIENNVTDKELLSWWQKSSLTNLAKVARRIFCIPASSASSERDFSAAGRVLEERRCSLKPESVDAILFLKSSSEFKV